MARVKIWAQSDNFLSNYSHLNEVTVANFQNNGKIGISWVDKALFSDRKNTVQGKLLLDKCYLDSALSKTTVKRWYADFKHGRTDTNDSELPGCPNSSVVSEKKQNKNSTNLFWPIVNWSCVR